MKIKQANGEPQMNQKNLATLVNTVVSAVGFIQKGGKLLSHILCKTAVNLDATFSVKNEEWHVCWTTYSNPNLWFDNWEQDVIDLSFSCPKGPQDVGVEGNVVFFLGQLERFLNLDKTCISLDGSSGEWGGHLSATFHDPSLLHVGSPTSKSSVTCTMISGNTAKGEALPPHFQLSTKAKERDHEQLRVEIIASMKKVHGKFGFDSEQDWPVTFQMNEKGGMDEDEEEFETYLMNSIVPLYPNAEDIPCKHVMVKLDSGPGRMKIGMIAHMRNLGFTLYPGVPNTMSVMQETDQNYGPFKSVFRWNLKNLQRTILL